MTAEARPSYIKCFMVKDEEVVFDESDVKTCERLNTMLACFKSEVNCKKINNYVPNKILHNKKILHALFYGLS